MTASNRSRMSPKGSGGSGTIGGSITNNQVAIGDVTPNTIRGSANFTWDGTLWNLNTREWQRRIATSVKELLPNFVAGNNRINQVYKYSTLNGDADFYYPSQYNKEVVFLDDADYSIDGLTSDTDNGKLFSYGRTPLTDNRTIYLPSNPVVGYTYVIEYLNDYAINPYSITLNGSSNRIISNTFVTTTLTTTSLVSSIEVYFNGTAWIVLNMTGKWVPFGQETLGFDTPSRNTLAAQNFTITAAITTPTYTPIAGCDASASGNIDRSRIVLSEGTTLENVRFNVYANTSSVDTYVAVNVNGSDVFTITIRPGATGLFTSYIGYTTSVGDLICLNYYSSSALGTGTVDISQVSTTTIVSQG